MNTLHTSRRSLGRSFSAFALATVAGVAATLCIGAAPQAAHAQCGPQWLAPLPPVGVGHYVDDVYAVTSWDSDGPGPLAPWLVVGGCIDRAGGMDANNVAAWDGVRWHPLNNISGPTRPDVKGSVLQLTTFDVDADGIEPAWLLAYGCTDRTASRIPTGLQRFTGDHWEMLFETGYPYVRNPMVQWNPYDDGRLPRRFGFGAWDRIHVFDGEEWTQIPARNAPGLDADVRALTAIIPWDADGNGPQPREIVAAFQRESDEHVVRLARWDGSAWNLFLGDIAAQYGSISLGAWDPDGRGPRQEQLFMKADGPLQWFDGAQWHAISDNGGRVFQPFDPDGNGPRPEVLVISGRSVWTGSTLEEIPVIGEHPNANSLCLWDPDGDGPRRAQLIGGGVRNLGWPSYTACNGIAIYDGERWDAIGRGPTGRCDSAIPWTLDGRSGLAVAGKFHSADGVRMGGVAFFDGASWQSMGASSGQYKSILHWDDDGHQGAPPTLVVASVSTTLMTQVRALSGDQWIDLGDPIWLGTPIVASLSAANANLFATGSEVNEVADHLYEWTGSQWLDRGEVGDAVECSATWIRDDGVDPRPLLVFGGYIRDGGAPYTARVIGWDGAQFVPVGDPLRSTSSSDPRVDTLIAVDFDGDGPQTQQLIAMGDFDRANDGIRVLNHIAVLVEDRWEPVIVPPEWSENWLLYDNPLAACVWDPDGLGPIAPTLRVFRQRPIPYSNAITAWEYDGQALVRLSDGATGYPAAAVQWDPDGIGPIPPRIQVVGAVADFPEYPERGSVFEAFLDDATPWVATPPRDASAFDGDTITLTASIANGYAELDGGVQFQWRRDGIAIQDGPAGASANGGVVAGASGTLHLSIPLTLTITNAAATDSGDYDLAVTNSCGTLASATARVQVSPFCAADFDGSGTIDATDLAAFFTAYETGAPNADVDRNGGIDGADIGAFFAAYQGGC